MPSRIIKKRLTERRRFQRVHVNLLGRFMRQDKEEFPCRLLNVSPGSVAIMAPVPLEQDERVIAYFDHIGRIEGTTTRTFDGGFALQLNVSAYKKEKLAEKLTWLANRTLLEVDEDRRHIRIVPNTSGIKLKYSDGRSRLCKVLDISISGASIAIKDRPALGMELIVGKMRGRVVRHHQQGVGIEFMDIQNPSAVRRHFG